MSKIEFFIEQKKVSANQMDQIVAKIWGVEEHLDQKWYCKPKQAYEKIELLKALELLTKYPDWYNRLAEPIAYDKVRKEFWSAQEVKNKYMEPLEKYPLDKVMEVESIVPYIQLLDEWIRLGVIFRVPEYAPTTKEPEPNVPKHIAQEIDYTID